MYRTLFDVAGLAMAGWLLLILLPTWRVTRRVAEAAIFPLFLCLLYLVGIVAVVRELGPGFMADFGSVDGVVGLLQVEAIAIVAWIHILAFDQVVAVLIYRDNMTHRIVPVPVQSIILFATLMLGPVGFLSYWLIRTARRRSAVVAWGQRADVPLPASRPSGTATSFAGVVTGAAVVDQVVGLWKRHALLTAVGMAGFILAGVTSVVAAIHGGWHLPPEGRLLEAVKFDVALAIFLLTLALILPLAPMTATGRRRWATWLSGLAVFGYLMENVQAWRGLDPRFSQVAGPVDQILAGVFLLQAMGMLVLFVIMMRTFFRPDALPDHVALRLSMRYGTVGALGAFLVGMQMSALAGRTVAAAGDVMLIHAAGFHTVQAVPLVALLLGSRMSSMAESLRLTHAAGIGWLLLCAGLFMQAVQGHHPATATPALAISLIGVVVWLGATALALVTRARRRRLSEG